MKRNFINQSSPNPEVEFRRGNAPVSRVIGKTLNSSFRKRGFTESRIITEWARIVGDELALRTTPLKIGYARSFPKELKAGKPAAKSSNVDNKQTATVLKLAVQSSWATQIQHMEPQILERISSYFGFKAVEKLVIMQTLITRAHPKPVPKRDLSIPDHLKSRPDIVAVHDESLKNALLHLGKAIIDGYSKDY
jgi:hypothetical protein